jgi:hypothetical protein
MAGTGLGLFVFRPEDRNCREHPLLISSRQIAVSAFDPEW